MELYSGDAYMEELMKAKNQLTTPAKKRNLADITNSPSRSSPLKVCVLPHCLTSNLIFRRKVK